LISVQGMNLAQTSLMGSIIMLWLYFAAFNLLEASLPSLISKVAPPQSKGTAMGVYSSAQFLGIFVGGIVGGYLHGQVGIEGVFYFDVAVLSVWLLVAMTMKHPRYLVSQLIKVKVENEEQARRLSVELTGVRGVAEAVIIVEDGIAYLKVDKRALDREALHRFAAHESV
ncbi:MAG: MFS transporter, partial [Gammaproteobacteria bacterium]|nr:MFS transporter [Gammaproteobacteria bacterium]